MYIYIYIICMYDVTIYIYTTLSRTLSTFLYQPWVRDFNLSPAMALPSFAPPGCPPPSDTRRVRCPWPAAVDPAVAQGAPGARHSPAQRRPSATGRLGMGMMGMCFHKMAIYNGFSH